MRYILSVPTNICSGMDILSSEQSKLLNNTPKMISLLQKTAPASKMMYLHICMYVGV